jgi:iron complex outermembrane recepter protein
MTRGKLHTLAAAASIAFFLLGLRAAHAQSAPAADAHSGDESASRLELSEVVVTGTRIAGVIPTSPVITLDRATIDRSGYASIGQLLLAIPQNFGGGQNPGVVGARVNDNSVSGAYSPNIHGLGADSTLTLVDGRRFAYDGFTNGVDLSTIPLAAIDRVEIVTDGASAIYGSDAVAGVVNVILKQRYDGVTADARYGGVTSGHSAQAQYSVLGGHDWSSGNALLAYEYSHEDPLFASDRPFSAGAAQPTSLLPELNRNSVFGDLRQAFGERVTASVEGLYTARSFVAVFTQGPTSTYQETRVRQYGISPTLEINLPAGWSIGLSGTISRDRDDEDVPGITVATQRLKSNSAYSYLNELSVGELQATGSAFELPSGPVKVALGGGYRHERFQNLTPATGTVVLPSVDSSRDIDYGYGELELPVVTPNTTRLMLERLDLSAAFRYERYSDFGSQSTPKVGLLYVPTDYLHLRATWSKSFRAPELLDVYGPRQLYLFPATTLGGTAGRTTLLEYGSNPLLGPETARSAIVGFDLLWPRWPSLRITPTYFHIDYDNRLVQPIDNTLRALSNPVYAPFITTTPTPAQLQAAISQASTFVNYAGAAYDPTIVESIIHDNYQNATVQHVHGIDLTAADAWRVLGGELAGTASFTWLAIVQRTIGTAPETELTGTLFNPPKFRSRASLSWQRGGFGFTATVNYVDGELDNTGKTVYPVASWSTLDAQLSYMFDRTGRGILDQVRATLTVQNLLDRDPPHVVAASTTFPALSYDSTNASPLGRFVVGYLSKSW